jgi:hypothetical protein
MIPGSSLVLSCPHCSRWHSLDRLQSGNTFGAEEWSDGRCFYPMLLDTHDVTRCRRCQKFFWVDDATVIGQIRSFESFGDLPRINRVRFRLHTGPFGAARRLRMRGILQALEAGLGDSPEKERRLRTLAWHTANDRVRGGTPHSKVLSDAYRQNLLRLRDLPPPIEAEAVLARAEIARELGDFTEALRQVNELPNAVERSRMPLAEMYRWFYHDQKSQGPVDNRVRESIDAHILAFQDRATKIADAARRGHDAVFPMSDPERRLWRGIRAEDGPRWLTIALAVLSVTFPLIYFYVRDRGGVLLQNSVSDALFRFLVFPAMVLAVVAIPFSLIGSIVWLCRGKE